MTRLGSGAACLVDESAAGAYVDSVKTCVVCGWSGDWPSCQSCDESAWLVDAEESPELSGDFSPARHAAEQAEALVDTEAA